MKARIRRAGWIAYAGLMAAAGWNTVALLEGQESDLRPRHPTKSHARGSTFPTRLDTTTPQLHERIAAHFAHWNAPSGAPTLPEKLAELTAVRSWELRELGSALLGVELLHADLDEAVQVLVAEIEAANRKSHDAVDALRTLLDRLTDHNPTRAWKILTSLPANLTPGYDLLGEALLARRLKADPDSVFHYALTHFSPYNSQRETLWELIARELAAVNLPAARETLSRMPGDCGAAISAVATKWAESEPEAAIRWASRFDRFYPNPAVRVFHDWIRRDPIAALAMENQYSIATLSGSMSVREQLVASWARLDPKAALSWALGENGSGYLREAVAGIHHPALVLKLARKHSRDAELHIAPHLAQSFVQSDPPAALDWLQALPEQPEANRARMRALNALGFGDPDAQALGRAHFEELWRSGIDLTRIGQGYHYDQAGLASGVLTLFADDPVRLWKLVDEVAGLHGGVDAMVRVAAPFNYDAAAEYLLSHTVEISSHTIKNMVTSWSEQDPSAASAFAGQYEKRMKDAHPE